MVQSAGSGSCGIEKFMGWRFPSVFTSTFTPTARYDSAGGGFHMKLRGISSRLLQNSSFQRQLQVSTVSGDGPYMGDGVLAMPSAFWGSFRKVKAYTATASTLALVLGCLEMWYSFVNWCVVWFWSARTWRVTDTKHSCGQTNVDRLSEC